MKYEPFLVFIYLIRFSKRLTTAFDQKLYEERITLTQYEALMILTALKSLKPGDLTEAIKATKGSVTVLVDRLEREGWVRREENEEDKRSSFVTLTTAGKKKFERATAVIQRAADEIAEEISKDDLSLISEGLHKINERMERRSV